MIGGQLVAADTLPAQLSDQEFWTLTLEERKRVAGTILETVAGRVPVLVGVSHTSYRDAIDLAKHAQAGGADLVMAWPPYYGPRSAEGMHAFFKRLADAVDIGICTYSSTLSELGYYLTPEEVAKLAEIDTVCAVKEASLSLDKYSAMMMEAGHLLAISSPLDLTACGHAIDRGFNRMVYSRMFLKTLKPKHHRVDVVRDFADVIDRLAGLRFSFEPEQVRERRLRTLDLRRKNRLLPDVHVKEQFLAGQEHGDPVEPSQCSFGDAQALEEGEYVDWRLGR